MDLISYILSRKYVDNSISGITGVLAGKNCTIYSSTKSGDTTTIVFKWTADDGTERTTEIQVEDGETPTITSTEITSGHRLTFTTQDPVQSVSFDVMDGAKGDMGVSVVASNVDENNNLTLTLSNGNVIDAGKIKAITNVDNMLSTTSSNPVENKVITNALNNKVDKEMGKGLFSDEEKTKLANIEDGAQVNVLEKLIVNGQEATITDKSIALTLITSAVSNLQNYYLKTETYTKQEVEDLIGSTVGVTIEIVEQLPAEGQSNVIYFLPTETEGVYSQYIYTTDGWILIGSTTVDLSNYYTKAQVDTLLNGKQNVLTIDAFPTAMSNNPVASGGVYSAIAQMQPQFQFANMPTASSANLGFVYQYTGVTGTYVQNMFYRCVYDDILGEYKWEEVIFHATVTVDSAISGTSTNPVQNKVIKEALDTKQDIMQYSTMPSAQDNLGKVVQYIGTNTANYINGYFYKAIYNSESDVYLWTVVKFSADMLVDNALSSISENPVQNKVITNKFDEYKTAFTGTEEEWNALTSEEQNVYDIINITNDGDVLNLGVYLEKKTAMPVASEDVENKIYLYTGTTTQNYKKGVAYQCVSDGQTPATYSWVALIDFGTASTKNSTDRVSPNNTDLVESQSVYSAINTALSSIYTPRGDISCAELTSALLISDNVGNVYETSDSGTTTALFLQGAGHPIATGDNVGIINAGEGRILFNLMANAFDLTDYQKKDLANTIEGATTVEGALGALSTDKQPKDLTTTVESATTVEGALGALSDNKQAKTLTASVESQTTVEGALGALSTNKATQTEVNDIVNVLGAKNLLPSIKASKTVGDVTFTLNGDGSITANGTASNTIYVDLVTSQSFLGQGNYVLSGGVNANQFIYVNTLNSGTYIDTIARAEGEDAVFSINYSGYNQLTVGISITSGQSVDHVTFYPMIRLASDPDNTYVPYAMTNRQMTPYVQAISNPNLLDNPWFTVNQRGQSSYTVATGSTLLTVDRWHKFGGVVNVVDGGVELITSDSSADGNFYAEYLTSETEFKQLFGNVVTLSVKIGDNVYSESATMPQSHTSSWQSVITINCPNGVNVSLFLSPSVNGRLQVSIRVPKDGNTYAVRAVKLELGSVSTLAMDTAPNYATELLKCQRYFVNVFLNKVSYAGPYFAIGDAGALYMNLPLAVPLRAVPNATLDSADIHILGEGASAIVTTCAVKAIYPNNAVAKIKIGDFASTEFVPITNGIYSLNFFDSNSCKFWLSADL